MAFKVRKAGAWADTGTVNVRKAGAWATAGFVKVMKAGVWTQVWPVALVSISNTTVSRSGTTNTVAAYVVNTSGVIEKIQGAITTSFETWLLSGAAADYEVRATLDSGDTPAGTLDTWLALSSTRSWSLEDATDDATALTCGLTIEIRLVSSGVVQDIATVTITSNKLGA